MSPDEARVAAEIRKSWFDKWSSCARADRTTVESAITRMYEEIALKRPEFVWVASPAEAVTVGYQMRKKLRVTVWSALRDVAFYNTADVREDLTDRFSFASHNRVFDCPELPEDKIGINFWYRRTWGAVNDFSDLATATIQREAYRIAFNDRVLDNRATVAREIWYWWPFQDVCIVSERPAELRIEDDRLHSLTAPAVKFRDGWSAYAVRGVIVPREWVEHRDAIPVEVALTWPNIEQRRIAAEIVGWAKVIEKLGATVVDENANPQIGTLLRVNLPDVLGALFLKVECGTKRTFCLPVPSTMRTALEANAWTYDVTGDQLLKLEVRT